MTTAVPDSDDSRDGPRLEILDVLRGLAALAVCVFHLLGRELESVPVFGPLCMHGYLGVYAFFVISGYVIPRSLHCKITSFPEYRRFLIRRLIRLYPVYAVAVIFTVILWYVSTAIPGFRGNGPAISTLNYLANFTLTADLANQPWILVVSWTLAIEAQYYVLIGLSMPLLNHRNVWIRYGTLWAWVLAALMVPSNGWVTAYGPIFALGIALYMRGKSLLGPRAFAGFLLLVTLVQLRGMEWSLDSDWGAESSVPLTSLLVAAGTVLAIVKGSDFSSHWLVWVGKISYSLYLLHVPIGGRVVNLAHRLGQTWWIELIAMIAAVGLSMAVAHIFFRLVEAPSHRWARAIRVTDR